jgi:hypothetical protein
MNVVWTAPDFEEVQANAECTGYAGADVRINA